MDLTHLRDDDEVEVDPRTAVQKMTQQVEVAKDLVVLGRERALFDHLDAEEIEKERSVAVLERTLDRDFRAWSARRDLKSRKRRAKWNTRLGTWRRWQDDRFAQQDKRDASSDNRWHTRAQRVRKRLTSTDARIATQIRSATRWSNLLIALMIGGMAYTGFVVQGNFVPSGNTADPKFWLSLLLEALSSVALMALMRVDTRAALAGITSTKWETARGWAVKGALLLASLAAASGPSIKASDFMGVVQTGWAPVLVAAVLVIHDRIARSDAQILLKLTATADHERVQHLAAVAALSMQHGLLEPSRDNKAGETAPSASRLATFFKISKPDAMAVRNAVNAQPQHVG